MRIRLSPTGRALLISAFLALVAGIALLSAGDGSAANALAMVAFGVAGVLAVSLVFLMVGESEDRARREVPPETAHPPPAAPHRPPARPRRPSSFSRRP